MAPDGQALVETRPTNQSNWLGSFLMGAAIGMVISLTTILFFEWYFFAVVDGLAMSLSPIVETLRRIEGYPQTRRSFRDLERRQSRDHFAASLEQHHDQPDVESLPVSVPLAADLKTAAV